MAYGLKYTSQFDSFKQLQSYQLDIFKKDFIGTSTTIQLSGNPVVHEWQEDDAKAPIRGSTLNVSILTDKYGISLIDFYSEDDYGFYVEFKCTNTDQFLFKGYLLQDDSQELQVDFTHEIQLTFTDGLGLLKDITLDRAAVIIGTETTISAIDFYNPAPTANLTICTFDSRVTVLQPGDNFSLTDGTNTYNLTCFSINYNIALGWCINIGIDCPFSGTVTFDLIYTIAYPLVGYVPLIDILKLCLKSCLLNLRLNSFITIYPIGGTIKSTWDDTFVDVTTFRIDTNSWMNCYDILDKIMTRFNTSLFQAEANWAIVRWDEMYRYTELIGATIRGNYYDEDFIRIAYTSHKTNFTFMAGSDMETGVVKSIVRPYKYVKETFNYIQPSDLLCNSNAQNLGDLIQQFDIGTKTYKDYGLNSWFDGPYSPIPLRFIRITYDNDPTSETYKKEETREIVISGTTGSQPQSAKSCDIQITKGDGISFSFRYRTSNSEPGPVNNVFIITLDDGTNIYKLNNNGTWTLTGGFTYSIPTGDNANIWHDVNIESNEVPVSGILNVYLDQASSSLDQTFYKDLTLNINYYINKSKKIIGHTHTDTQSLDIKNNSTEDIYLDNAPRYSIKGTLYLESYTSLLRDRTSSWEYPLFNLIPIEDRFTFPSLGAATTQESLFTRYKMRAKYEGVYLSILQGIGPYKFLNPLSVFLNSRNSNDYRFVVGKLSIDYKNASCNLTLYELLDSSGTGFDDGIITEFRLWKETRLYEFNYLYEN